MQQGDDALKRVHPYQGLRNHESAHYEALQTHVPNCAHGSPARRLYGRDILPGYFAGTALRAQLRSQALSCLDKLRVRDAFGQGCPGSESGCPRVCPGTRVGTGSHDEH